MPKKPGKIPINRRLSPYLLANEERYRHGKDKRVIDLESINGLARIGATINEIATVLGVSDSWVIKERDSNPAFSLALEQGYAIMRTSLRRAQIDLALSGSAPLLIWLGKQYLGQSDKHEQTTKTDISITVSRAMDELRNIPKEQLMASHALLTGGGHSQVIENSEQGQNAGEGAPPV